jgi:hypothetical protein
LDRVWLALPSLDSACCCGATDTLISMAIDL